MLIQRKKKALSCYAYPRLSYCLHYSIVSQKCIKVKHLLNHCQQSILKVDMILKKFLKKTDSSKGRELIASIDIGTEYVKALIAEIIGLAMRAPSSMNTQPWNFYVIWLVYICWFEA